MTQPERDYPLDTAATPSTDAAWQECRHRDFTDIAQIMYQHAQRLEREGIAFGKTIAEVAERHGIYNGQASLTGPQLLMLVYDLSSALDTSRACTAERDGRVQELEAPRSETGERDAVLAEVERGLHDLKNLKLAAGDKEQARGVAAAEFHVRAMQGNPHQQIVNGVPTTEDPPSLR